MSTGHRYIATAEGYLSNPYRVVKVGGLVVLDKPLDQPSSWLVPEDEYEPNKVKPLFGHMTEVEMQNGRSDPWAERNAKLATSMPSTSNPAYDESMKEVDKMHKQMDAKKAETEAAAKKDDKNKDVL